MSRLRSIVLASCLLVPASSGAETRYRPVTLTSTFAAGTTNIQVPIEISFTTGLDPSGASLRFASVVGGAYDIPYYIERWNFGGTSLVWVKIASMPASSSKTIYMYYGNTSGGAPSDFAATFPNAYQLAAGSVFLSGVQNFDWFRVGPGATMFVNPGSPLFINARRVIIDGTIDASGKGYFPSGVDYDIGQGPGGGGGGFQGFGGAGGGGHGGVGGAGGSFFPAAGGPAYGSAATQDILMGSSGGNGDATSPGGSGGGAVSVATRLLTLTGALVANGVSAPSNGTSTGGGGGSGGGILLRAYDMELSGVVSAKGGAGAPAGAAPGGGGAGGRIKRFHGNHATNVATLNVSGGPGGDATAQAGNSGTDYGELIAFAEVTATVGSEVLLGVEPSTVWHVRVGSPLPNPARDGVTMSVELDRSSTCRVEIVDVQGRCIRTLDVALAPGAHEISWDLRDDHGQRVPVGVYLAHAAVVDRELTRRIVVMQ